MAELDMPVMETKKFFTNAAPLSFWLCFLLLCIIAGCICWLSLGKVSSVAARIDGTVYTVAPQISAALQDFVCPTWPGCLTRAGIGQTGHRCE